MPIVLFMTGCAHGGVAKEKPGVEIQLGPEVVQGAVTFEPGTQDGAIVPEVSAPRLRAIRVEEKIEGNRLIERHREWVLDGEPRLLGIPVELKRKSESSPALKTKSPGRGGSHEN